LFNNLTDSERRTVFQLHALKNTPVDSQT